MKKTVIAGALLLIGGFLIGFTPEYFKLTDARHESDGLRQQLNTSKTSEALNSFRNRIALLYIETLQRNFTVALDMASKDFTDLRNFTDKTPDPSLKQELGKILSSRDTIIAGLAKADPAVSAQILDLFLEMQKIK